MPLFRTSCTVFMKIFFLVVLLTVSCTLEASPASTKRPLGLEEDLAHELCSASPTFPNSTYSVSGEVDGEWCCECPPGHYVAADCKDKKPRSTLCQPCPDGQYATEANHNYYCANFSMCNHLQYTKLIRGNSTQDNRCICVDGTYSPDPSISGCKKYQQCAKGFGVQTPGNSLEDLTCELCSDGMCADDESSTQKCEVCVNTTSATNSSLEYTTTVSVELTIVLVVTGFILGIICCMIIYFCWWRRRKQDIEGGSSSSITHPKEPLLPSHEGMEMTPRQNSKENHHPPEGSGSSSSPMTHPKELLLPNYDGVEMTPRQNSKENHHPPEGSKRESSEEDHHPSEGSESSSSCHTPSEESGIQAHYTEHENGNSTKHGECHYNITINCNAQNVERKINSQFCAGEMTVRQKKVKNSQDLSSHTTHAEKPGMQRKKEGKEKKPQNNNLTKHAAVKNPKQGSDQEKMKLLEETPNDEEEDEVSGSEKSAADSKSNTESPAHMGEKSDAVIVVLPDKTRQDDIG